MGRNDIKDTNLIFAKNLNKLLSDAEISRTEFAYFMGVSLCTVVAWLKGRNTPSNDNKEKVADFFHISVYEMYSKDMKIEEYANDSNKTYFKKVVATNLTALFEKNRYNKNQIATILNVPNSKVWNWCEGTYLPSQEYLDKICKMFNIEEKSLYKVSDGIVNEFEKEKTIKESIYKRKVFVENLQFYLKENNLTISNFSKKINIKSSTISN